MIVGMDWLQAYSPRKIHWLQKWLSIPYQGKMVLLQGVLPVIPEGFIVEIASVVMDSNPVKFGCAC